MAAMYVELKRGEKQSIAIYNGD